MKTNMTGKTHIGSQITVLEQINTLGLSKG